MRALLDVNVLIALLDADHMHHEAANHWLADNAEHGWASCPLTENGCARIMSQPRYPNALPTHAVLERLHRAAATRYHEFWPDSVSLLDAGSFRRDVVQGPRQLTDAYLLALAVANQGRLATFDGSVPLALVPGARPDHLAVID